MEMEQIFLQFVYSNTANVCIHLKFTVPEKREGFTMKKMLPFEITEEEMVQTGSNNVLCVRLGR